MSLEADVRRLTDLEAIRDLARRYAHCVWQKDAGGAADLFAEDGVMDTGDRPPLVGRPALRETYTAMFAISSFHPTIHNHVIELASDGAPDTATGTCYVTTVVKKGDVGPTILSISRYTDHYTKQNGQWRIQRREITIEFGNGELGSQLGFGG